MSRSSFVKPYKQRSQKYVLFLHLFWSKSNLFKFLIQQQCDFVSIIFSFLSLTRSTSSDIKSKLILSFSFGFSDM